MRVSGEGGAPRVVIADDPRDGYLQYPEVLPDGKAVLFRVGHPPYASESIIYVQSLVTGKRTALFKGDVAHYLPTGHLVFARSGTLFAVPFDSTRLAVTGVPVPILLGVQHGDESGPQLAISRTGVVAYVAAIPDAPRHLVWVDRTGVSRDMNAPPRFYRGPRLSPDGQRLAVTIQAETSDIWVYDLTRQTLGRVTSDWNNTFPVWTPDGSRLAFARGNLDFGGRMPPNLYWKPADTRAPAERLVVSDHYNRPASWSPDGRVLAFVDQDPDHPFEKDLPLFNIWWVSRDDLAHPHAFLQTKFSESAPVFSPDGHWLAYVSNESGRQEIYVERFPDHGEKLQLSKEGGKEPVWPRRGHEVFFRNGDAMMAVDVTLSPTFSVRAPQRLFAGDYLSSYPFTANYDVTPDGRMFVMVKIADTTLPTQINVVVNWFEELKKRVPTK
jgi:serine/threonine-protein kinase